MTNATQARANLRLLIGTISVLILVGFIFIYSSSSIYALEYAHDSAFFVKKQFLGLVLGLIAALILSRIPLHLLYRLVPWGFIGALGLTMLTLVPGLAYRMHGSSRWLRLGGFMFQPSEVLKWAVVLYIAYLLARKESMIKMPYRRYVPILIVLALASLLLLKQPDFGSMVTLGATIVALFFIAYPDWKYVVGLVIAAIPVLGALIWMEPYRLKRILIFLNPWDDPQGAGFQVIQSLIAVGSGGLLGVGISHSRQKFFYLPMQHTDFIFSIIAEETGFVGSSVVVLLYALVLYSGLRLSWQLPTAFARYTVQGFVLLISIQAIINMAVATGLFPTKGIGLPFVSYGLSSLVCGVAMIGIIVRCAQDETV